MKSIESMGLLKFDFLGLKTLTIMDKTVQFIKKQGGDIDLSTIPVDDEETYKYLISGETTGIFQLESAGMRDILARMQPSRFEDLIALVALYRPGPMGWIDDFIKNKKGEAEVTDSFRQFVGKDVFTLFAGLPAALCTAPAHRAKNCPIDRGKRSLRLHLGRAGGATLRRHGA